MTKPKLVFIGRCFHAKTGSDNYLIRLFEENFEVVVLRRELFLDKELVKNNVSLSTVYNNSDKKDGQSGRFVQSKESSLMELTPIFRSAKEVQKQRNFEKVKKKSNTFALPIKVNAKTRTFRKKAKTAKSYVIEPNIESLGRLSRPQ